jgi:hyperosmotically inducible protein
MHGPRKFIPRGRSVLNFTSANYFARPVAGNGAGNAKRLGMLQKYSIPRFAALAGVLIAGLALNPASAQTPVQPDNTKVNQQDRAQGAVTADHQKDNRNDRDLTQQIRKAVIADKSLSTYAHNVKIVSQGGTVTLKGPVRSEDEHKAVVAKAEGIAGAGRVTDQLSVKPKAQ